MWKYTFAAFLFIAGAIEILLALNARMREELMKNSPVQSTRMTPAVLFISGLSAFAMALVLIFYNRFF